MKHTKGLCSVRKSRFAQGCRFALWALVAVGVVLAYGDAAPGFTVDTAIPAGNAIVNSTDGGKTFSYPLDGKATTRGITYTFAPY